MQPQKLIPQNLAGTETILSEVPVLGRLVGDKSLKDVSIAMSPAAIGLVVFDLVAPPSFQQYGIFVAGFLAFLGVVVLLALPDYARISELLFDIRNYKRDASYMRHRHSNSETAIDRPFYEADEKTQNLTHVKTIHGEKGALERRDGAMIGAVKIEPMNMVTANGRDWAQSVDAFSAFINNTLDFHVQIYAPTRNFDSDMFLEPYRQRLQDQQIQSNPILSQYIEHYVDVGEQIESDRYVREFYIVIPVPKGSVERGGADAGLDWGAVPVVGDFLGVLSDTKNRGTETEMEKRQFTELNERKTVIAQEMASTLEGCDAEEVSAGQMAILLKEFWEGRNLNHKEAESFYRSKPVIAGGSDAAALNEQNIQEGEQQ